MSKGIAVPLRCVCLERYLGCLSQGNTVITVMDVPGAMDDVSMGYVNM